MSCLHDMLRSQKKTSVIEKDKIFFNAFEFVISILLVKDLALSSGMLYKRRARKRSARAVRFVGSRKVNSLGK